MKNFLIFILSFLPILVFGQNNINVTGSATTNRLAILEATNLNANFDILEIQAPANPTGNGQFIECQIGAAGEIRAQINYDGSAFFNNQIQVGSQLLLDDSGLFNSSEILMSDSDGHQTVRLRAKDSSGGTGGEILFYANNTTGGLTNTIEIDGNWANTGRGRIRTSELQILGGSDIAENFDFAANKHNQAIQPGMLVAIDPVEPGKLSITTQAYDKRVVGAISGANGVNTGLYMSQTGSIADGEHPVALAGRAYILADAAQGAIRPGDFLTSSPTPGHVMKVKNHKKAQGAIVGKAMSTLDSGTGYVLVLINLQ